MRLKDVIFCACTLDWIDGLHEIQFMSIYFGVCVYVVCVWLCLCMCVSVCACRCSYLCVHMWKPKVDREYLALLLFTLFFRQGILLNLEFAILARLAGYKPLVSVCLHRLSTGIKDICHLYLTWVLEMQSHVSSPHAHITITFPSEQCPQHHGNMVLQWYDVWSEIG